MTSRRSKRSRTFERAESNGTHQEQFAGPSKVETKTHQLCRQIDEAISCALAGAANSILRDLLVVEVVPVRGAAAVQLLVSREAEQEEEYIQETEIEEALARASGYLRGEVAKSIHRKRVPSLHFVVVPQYSYEENSYEKE